MARLVGAGTELERPAPDVVVLRGGRTRAVIRPSGTEPKLKAYLEVVEPPPDGPTGLPEARTRAQQRLEALRTRINALLTAPAEPEAD
jgi:phosphomannomutase